MVFSEHQQDDGVTAKALIQCSAATAAGRSTSATQTRTGGAGEARSTGSTPKEARAKASAVRERLRANLPARGPQSHPRRICR